MSKFFVTTPIYYVNDVPHIGHAYTTVAADVVARYWRTKIGQENVLFTVGTDEHGVKIAQSARKVGLTPKHYTDQIVPKFKKAWRDLKIDYDIFIRTTDQHHKKTVQEVLGKIYQKGYIYKATYEGLYCEGCERFLTDEDLEDGKCPLHPNKQPVYQKEKNYFFKLSSFKDYLLDIFEKDKVQIRPRARKKEIIGKLKKGLQDISFSRESVKWGIPLPWDKSQTAYVWIDALLNYYTATRSAKNKRFWPPDLHLVGKDILWFHTVIWCALLKAADINPPKSIFAHGFFTVNGQKMSKSLGNVIKPQDLVKQFGAEAARYLLLSEFPFGQDGDFSLKKMKTRYNAELANGLGNLTARIFMLAQKASLRPKPKKSKTLEKTYHRYLQKLDFYSLSKLLRSEIKNYNQYLDKTQPWKLLEEEKMNKLKKTLQYSSEGLYNIFLLLAPFMPKTTREIQTKLQKPTKIHLFPRK